MSAAPGWRLLRQWDALDASGDLAANLTKHASLSLTALDDDDDDDDDDDTFVGGKAALPPQSPAPTATAGKAALPPLPPLPPLPTTAGSGGGGGAAAAASSSSASPQVSKGGVKSTLAPSMPRVVVRHFGDGPGCVVGDGVFEAYPFRAQLTLLDGCCLVSLVPAAAANSNANSNAPATAMGAMSVAMASRFDAMPHATTLLSSGGGEAGEADEAGESGEANMGAGLKDDVTSSVSRLLVKMLNKSDDGGSASSSPSYPQVFVTSSLPPAAADYALDIAKHVAAAIKEEAAAGP